MLRNAFFALTAMVALAACAPPPPVIGPDGRALPTVYKITASERGKIPARMLESVNSLRQSSGLPPVILNAELSSAAEAHSADMALQNRAWHFGSDGSSPIDRIRRAGYPGQLIGEDISETYETELETLSAWMEDPDTRRVILAPDARQMGFGWHQTNAGKLWWTLIMGS